MIRYRLADILEGTKGALLSAADGAGFFTGLSIDSRTTRRGEVFFALKGKVFDGHEFIREAWKKGAAMAVVERGASLPSAKLAPVPLLLVEDTTKALGDLASFWRKKHRATVIAVAGSVGKTTTKEMIFSLLSSVGPCLKNPGNFNNEIGLPLSLMEMDDRHRFAVLEIGANAPGEIRRLTGIMAPDAAVATRLGWAHLEGFGSPEVLIREKMSVLEGLRPDGWFALNADDPLQVPYEEKAPCPVITYGLGHGAVSAGEISREGPTTSFVLRTPRGSGSIRLRASGSHFVENALAAVAACEPIEIPLELVIGGLGDWTPPVQRGGVFSPFAGVHFIDDTYNANPLSVRTALAALAQLSHQGVTVAVLGEMMELGEFSREGHLGIGRAAAELGIDFLLAVGPRADLIAQGAVEKGMHPSRVRECPSEKEAVPALGELLNPGVWVLFKGSRAARMERIMEAFSRKEPSTRTGGL